MRARVNLVSLAGLAREAVSGVLRIHDWLTPSVASCLVLEPQSDYFLTVP